MLKEIHDHDGFCGNPKQQKKTLKSSIVPKCNDSIGIFSFRLFFSVGVFFCCNQSGNKTSIYVSLDGNRSLKCHTTVLINRVFNDYIIFHQR